MTPRKTRNPKFVWQDAFIRSGLTGNTGFIGLLMATKDNGDGQGLFLSANHVNEMTGLDEKTVRTHIGKLVEAGWVRVTQRGGNQGGVARASRYELTIPTPPQPGDASSQPGDAAYQAGGSTRVVDPISLDPPVVDPSLPTFKVEDLKEGDEMPDFLVKTLDKEVRDHFYPSFEKDGIMVYQEVSLTQSSTDDAVERVEDTQPTERERQAFARQMREEGFDENGQPLKRRSPRNPSSRRRR